MNALVLGGGGSRGAYQFGVIKALRELGYEYQIVTGTSVGALNALFLGHQKYDLVEKMWSTIDFNGVVKYEYKSKNKSLETIINGIVNNGLELEPLENLIKENLSIEELRKSPIQVGIVYTRPGGKYSPINVSEIKDNKTLIDYVIASCSAYPILKKKDIDGELCYDGGFSDSLPIKLAKDMGAKKIIAIDIMSGIRKWVPLKGIEFLYIKPSKNLGFFLDFNRDIMNKNIELGYNDIMKNKEKILEFISK